MKALKRFWKGNKRMILGLAKNIVEALVVLAILKEIPGHIGTLGSLLISIVFLIIIDAIFESIYRMAFRVDKLNIPMRSGRFTFLKDGNFIGYYPDDIPTIIQYLFDVENYLEDTYGYDKESKK